MAVHLGSWTLPWGQLLYPGAQLKHRCLDSGATGEEWAAEGRRRTWCELQNRLSKVSTSLQGTLEVEGWTSGVSVHWRDGGSHWMLPLARYYCKKASQEYVCLRARRSSNVRTIQGALYVWTSDGESHSSRSELLWLGGNTTRKWTQCFLSFFFLISPVLFSWDFLDRSLLLNSSDCTHLLSKRLQFSSVYTTHWAVEKQ